MQEATVSLSWSDAPRQGARLHYIDWLRVIAILGVFLYHAVHPFDLNVWHIKNAEQSLGLTIVMDWFFFWGMPFFFMIAGAGAWFALRRRTSRQYAGERTRRLLIPFIFGAILFMPLMMYLEWRHNTALWGWDMPFMQFVLDRNPGFSPLWFPALGYHLWFLGFLFCYAILSLPLFRWLKGEKGRRLIAWLAGLAEQRGASLLFVLPFIAVMLVLKPILPREHDWGDFFYLMAYYILGFVLFADPRFATAIRRDGWLLLIAAVAAIGILLLMFAVGDPFAWAEMPTLPQFYLVWSLVAANGCYWSLFVLFIGMRFLDFSNTWLRYGQEAVLPFFMIHQPVIIVIAYFVVLWEAPIAVKLPVVVISSFAACLAIYELIIKHAGPLRSLFGMTSKPAAPEKVRMA